MRPSDVRQVLARLVAAYPTVKVEEDTAVLWAEQLAGVPVDVALLAAKSWIANEDRFPTVNKFLIACQRHARELASAASSDRPPCTRCVDGWVEVRGQTSTGDAVVEPCPDCAPAAYARWAGGHYAPDHACADCTAIRKGERRPSGIATGSNAKRMGGGDDPRPYL